MTTSRMCIITGSSEPEKSKRPFRIGIEPVRKGLFCAIWDEIRFAGRGGSLGKLKIKEEMDSETLFFIFKLQNSLYIMPKDCETAPFLISSW